MAKSTRNSGASFTDEELSDPVPPQTVMDHLPSNQDRSVGPVVHRAMIGNLIEGGDQSSVGSNSSQSSEDGTSSKKLPSQTPQEGAPDAENPSNPSGWAPGDVADSTDGSIQETETEFDEDDVDDEEEYDVPPYEEWDYRDLQAECKERGLPATGSSEELVRRLVESD